MTTPAGFERRYSQVGHELIFHYEPYGTESKWLKKITLVKNGSETDLKLSTIWVNGHPAQYLSSFVTSPLPENGTLHSLNTEFEIKTQDWNWYKKGDEHLMEIKVATSNETLNFSVIRDLHVLGLKWMIYRKKPELGKPDSSAHALILKKYPLSNFNKLEECLSSTGGLLRYENQDGSSRQSGLQKGEGVYSEGDQFRTFCAEIPQKANLACKLVISGYPGTGLLLGNNRILTVAHLLPSIKCFTKKDTAIFFYGENQKPLEITLAKVITFSPTPEHLPLSVSKLDLALIEVHPPSLSHFFTWFRWKKLNNRAQESLKNWCQFISTDQRMNIIHYPQKRDKETQQRDVKEENRSEQVTFRKNKVLSISHFEVHTKGDTDPASSGAPSFNDRGEFIGIHYTSECLIVNETLFKHWKELFKKLGLGNPSQSTEDSVSGFEGDSELKLYTHGENRGFWQRRSTDKKHLWALIQEKRELKTKKEAITWANTQIGGNNDLTLHAQCNVSINADAVVEFIKSPEKQSESKPKSGWNRKHLVFLISVIGLGLYLKTQSNRKRVLNLFTSLLRSMKLSQ